MRAAPATLAAAALLMGCACLPGRADFSADGEAAACPAVRRADAWVNRMPGPTPTDNALIVMIELETEARWMMQRSKTSSKDGVIVLDLIEGGQGHPGSAGWREAGARLPEAIEIHCGGRLHHRITDVTAAY